jgi:hypothetical protein
VLRATGGVGRVVHDYVKDGGALDSSIFTVNMDKVTSTPVLFSIFSLIASSVDGVISVPDAVAMTATCLGSSATDAALEVVRWCDAGAFYCDAMSLEVLIPSVLDDFVAKIAARKDLERLRVLLLTMHGFEGGSAGHSNENLVCKYIHEHPDVSVAKSEARVLSFRVVKEEPVLSLRGSSASTAKSKERMLSFLGDTPVSLDDLLGCVMPGPHLVGQAT